MPHRPEVCYPGAGWTPGDVHAVELQLSDDMKLPSRILQFSRGTENVMVLDYYIVDGQYSSDVERLRKKAWLGSGTIKYVAQVEVIASVPSKQVEDLQKANVTEFASESASLILELFEKAANDESLSGNEIGKDPNEQ